MATYSNNTTIRISGAIAVSINTGGTTLYTCPANSYAVVNVNWSTAIVWVRVGGANIGNPGVFSAAGMLNNIHVGPGQSVTTSAGAGLDWNLYGVQFTNSP